MPPDSHESGTSGRSGADRRGPVRRGPVLLTMCVGYFLVLLDVSALNVALPGLRMDLDVAATVLPWVVAGYAVPFAALLLIAGSTGDRLGHRRMVRSGLGTFGAASLACALAPDTPVLIAARAVQGAGAALLLPGTLAVLAGAYHGPDRHRAIGVWAAVGGLGLPAGPLVGGLLVQAWGWRAVFWLNVPVVAAALVTVGRVVPDDRGRDARPGRLDLAGTVLGTVFLGLLAVAAAARDVRVAGLAGLALAGFVAAERRADEPVVPPGLFASRAFSVSTAAAFVMNAVSQGMLFLLALLLQGVGARSPARAGLALLPAFAMLVLVPPVAGRLVARYGVRVVLVCGLMASAAGVGMLTVSTGTSSAVRLLPALVVWGAGLGLLAPAVVSGAVGSVPAERSGLAGAVNNAARQAGNAVGVPACAAVAGPVGGSFVAGVHVAAASAAVLLCVAAAVAGRLFPAHRRA